ncbi:iron-containing alcohol dehydrogenase family protein [Paenibacillus rigui]|uniref:Glycerol dehydrogenase n=1 Tax=Paenibacillus rigui TaxID=554312 RepID=A0A229UUC3_9BACL|nr:iron-containing alcohol dehydrogenase family protein [Paenibacillus rigui]OXM86765.1 glycerol dehydrogenase [Paenibacillus rigui]
MITIKSPKKYWNEPGVLSKSGPLIAEIGRRALIIAGNKALEAVKPSFLISLEEAGLSYSIAPYGGKVTTEDIEQFAETATEYQADVIIGVGGGKVLDLSKAVGGRRSLPVVAVPTIAATCASWAAVTVVYDQQGRSSRYLLNDRSPELLFADTGVLASAPKRFLASGIGDTIVKWYEIGVNNNDAPDGLDVRLGTQIGKLALDRLRVHALDAYQAAGTGEVTPALQETVDAIIVLAGLAGTVQGTTARAGIAHSIHNSLTHIPETGTTLHGEKVAYGLLTQVILEGRPVEEIDELALWLHKLGLPITLKELGIEQDPAAVAADIARRVKLPEGSSQGLSFEVHEGAIALAIQKADEWGTRIIHEAYSKS